MLKYYIIVSFPTLNEFFYLSSANENLQNHRFFDDFKGMEVN